MGKDIYSIRRNGSWAASLFDGRNTIALDGSINDAWQVVYNAGGQRAVTECTAITNITCTVATQADGNLLTWDEVPGIERFNIRRNGAWLETVTGANSVFDPFGTSDDEYLARYRVNGTVMDILCS